MSDYDYVIVGAGSAGCVLANRLSDSGAEVLLIEAGRRDRSPKIKIPAAFAQQFRTKLDWDYASGPEPGCEGRSLYVPRGKALGGSSSMNAMLYVRGHRDDYDGWRDDAGCTGWGWSDVLPYFKRSEHHEGGASPSHGVGGPLNVAPPRSPRPLTDLIVKAALADGYEFDPDLNDGDPDGICIVETTTKHGRRWSAADAFLRPAAGRPNLTVLTAATALGLEIRGDRVRGVRLGGKTPMAVARARREVILSAGAINSPQLLMLSGIGDPEPARRPRDRRDGGRSGRRFEPPGPPVRRRHLGLDHRRLPGGRREARRPRRLPVAPPRPVDVDRRRGDALRPLRR